MQLVDAMKISLNDDSKSNQANDFQMYLIALIPTLLESGNDPKNFLGAIHRFIKTNPENRDLWDYNLISMSQIIHKIPAFYLSDALQIVKVCFIIVIIIYLQLLTVIDRTCPLSLFKKEEFS